VQNTSFLLVIPAYNEADIIESAVRMVYEKLRELESVVWQIVVVDNGSTDNTAQLVLAMGLAEVGVLSSPVRGKGAAIVFAAREAPQSDAFGFIDADLSADPKHINDLLAVVLQKKADIAVGSRLLDKHLVNRGFLRTLTSELFNILRGMILTIPVRDTQCGLKVMNQSGREILSQCEETGWFFDMEFLARAYKKGLHIVEFPVTWNEYRFSARHSKLNVLSDGVAAVIAMIRIRRRISS
jgi:glycosyltransferase involved in cell wall biosynthesis